MERLIWPSADLRILRRIVDGLRALDRSSYFCYSQEPIAGYAHAYQVMAAHCGHRCPRYHAAAAVTMGEQHNRHSNNPLSHGDRAVGFAAWVQNKIDGSWSVVGTDGYRYTPSDFVALIADQAVERGQRW